MPVRHLTARDRETVIPWPVWSMLSGNYRLDFGLTCAEMRPFFSRVRSVWLQWLRAQGATLRKSSSKLQVKKKREKSKMKMNYQQSLIALRCSLEVVEFVVQELAYVPR